MTRRGLRTCKAPLHLLSAFSPLLPSFKPTGPSCCWKGSKIKGKEQAEPGVTTAQEYTGVRDSWSQGEGHQWHFLGQKLLESSSKGGKGEISPFQGAGGFSNREKAVIMEELKSSQF